MKKLSSGDPLTTHRELYLRNVSSKELRFNGSEEEPEQEQPPANRQQGDVITFDKYAPPASQTQSERKGCVIAWVAEGSLLIHICTFVILCLLQVAHPLGVGSRHLLNACINNGWAPTAVRHARRATMSHRILVVRLSEIDRVCQGSGTGWKT